MSTGNNANLHLSWRDQPLVSLNNAAFAGLFAAITLQSQNELTLKGTADVVAKTAIGAVSIDGITFDVPSSIKGDQILPSHLSFATHRVSQESTASTEKQISARLL